MISYVMYLSQENQRLLFNKFVQINASKLQAGKGSGLGLWLSKAFVERHGGVIGVKSDGEGHGCTFFLELPYFETKSNTSSKDNIHIVVHGDHDNVDHIEDAAAQFAAELMANNLRSYDNFEIVTSFTERRRRQSFPAIQRQQTIRHLMQSPVVPFPEQHDETDSTSGHEGKDNSLTSKLGNNDVSSSMLPSMSQDLLTAMTVDSYAHEDYHDNSRRLMTDSIASTAASPSNRGRAKSAMYVNTEISNQLSPYASINPQSSSSKTGSKSTKVSSVISKITPSPRVLKSEDIDDDLDRIREIPSSFKPHAIITSPGTISTKTLSTQGSSFMSPIDSFRSMFSYLHASSGFPTSSKTPTTMQSITALSPRYGEVISSPRNFFIDTPLVNVLIVDDVDMVRRMVEKIIKKYTNVCHQSPDGEDAVRKVLQAIDFYHVVVIDCNMDKVCHLQCSCLSFDSHSNRHGTLSYRE